MPLASLLIITKGMNKQHFIAYHKRGRLPPSPTYCRYHQSSDNKVVDRASMRSLIVHRCCTKEKVKRGMWSPEEDEKLVSYITSHGYVSWTSLPKRAGLERCGKSCRLRWINYLKPEVKRGAFTIDEEQIIIDVHRILGNRWSRIAKHLPGRTDNEVKNYWNSCIKKKLMAQGLDPRTHNLLKLPRSGNPRTPKLRRPKKEANSLERHVAPAKAALPPPTLHTHPSFTPNNCTPQGRSSEFLVPNGDEKCFNAATDPDRRQASSLRQQNPCSSFSNQFHSSSTDGMFLVNNITVQPSEQVASLNHVHKQKWILGQGGVTAMSSGIAVGTGVETNADNLFTSSGLEANLELVDLLYMDAMPWNFD